MPHIDPVSEQLGAMREAGVRRDEILKQHSEELAGIKEIINERFDEVMEEVRKSNRRLDMQEWSLTKKALGAGATIAVGFAGLVTWAFAAAGFKFPDHH